MNPTIKEGDIFRIRAEAYGPLLIIGVCKRIVKGLTRSYVQADSVRYSDSSGQAASFTINDLWEMEDCEVLQVQSQESAEQTEFRRAYWEHSRLDNGVGTRDGG